MPSRAVNGEVGLASAARGAGTYTSGPIGVPSGATHIVLMVHATASSGTPTLDASLEQSTDGSSWTAITGSSITQLTAAGNRVATANATNPYVRITSAVAGTTPNVTYAASVAFFGD